MAIALDTRRWSAPEAWTARRRVVAAAPLGRILVVEDEPRISSFLQRGLGASGFTTEVADTGEDALALAVTGRFDLVLLDSGLPDMSALDVLRELREYSSRLPVVMLTAGRAARDLMEEPGGADGFVAKPFSFDELLELVRDRLLTERPAAA